MRTFLATELPEEIKEELIRIQDVLRENLIAKFVEKENMHLTLKFFGETSRKQTENIKHCLKKIKFEKFKVNLGKIGFFPNKNYISKSEDFLHAQNSHNFGHINIVWVSLEPSDKIIKLKEEIEKQLENSDNQEKEKSQSHVTLARVKSIIHKEEFFERMHYLKIKPIEFEIKDFVLKKSTLTDKGPIYEDIERFELI